MDHPDHDIKLPSLAHGSSSASDDSKLKCSICDKKFSKVSHRRRHENDVHDVSPQYANTAILCNKCSLKFPSLKLYRKHLQAHDVIVGKVNHEFKSEEGKVLIAVLVNSC